jgi:hypothetical protein
MARMAATKIVPSKRVAPDEALLLINISQLLLPTCENDDSGTVIIAVIWNHENPTW